MIRRTFPLSPFASFPWLLVSSSSLWCSLFQQSMSHKIIKHIETIYGKTNTWRKEGRKQARNLRREAEIDMKMPTTMDAHITNS